MQAALDAEAGSGSEQELCSVCDQRWSRSESHAL